MKPSRFISTSFTMSYTKILTVFLIVISISKSLQLTVNCDYNKSPSVITTRLNWKLVTEPYSCLVTTLNIKSKLLVRNVTGKHLDGKTNNDVKALKIIGGGIIPSTGNENTDQVMSVCEVIPDGIGTFFPNIEALTVWRSNLKTVSSNDLKQFPKLREIWLFTGELEYLESKLFQYNPNVEVVSFNANQIQFIGGSFFNYLPKLQKAFFNDNECVDGQATDAEELNELKTTIKEKCVVDENAAVPLQITVDCKFEISSTKFKTANMPYSCTLRSPKFDRKLFVAKATGSHTTGRSDSDVKALQIAGKNCQILPGYFGVIFPNIEVLSISNAGLKLITNRDLQQFSNLKEIWLQGNELNYLEGKLFEFNPNVEVIVVRDNQIKFVGDNFFNYLPKLREADFYGNECFDGAAADLNLNAVRERVKDKCVVDEPTFIYTTIRK